MSTVTEFRERVSERERYGESLGRQSGTRDERARCRAILSSGEAKLRFAFARHLALETDLDSDAAIAILRAAPVERDGASSASGTRSDADFYAATAAAARAGSPGREPGDEPGLKSRFVREAEKLRAEGKFPTPPRQR